MLFPKSIKYRKSHKPLVRKGEQDYKMIMPMNSVYCLKAEEAGRITAVQIEAARKSIRKNLNKKGEILINIFPDRPITSKPAEVRMGKGKGSFDKCVYLVKEGTVLFEVRSNGLLKKNLKEALRVGGLKLAVKARVLEYRV